MVIYDILLDTIFGETRENEIGYMGRFEIGDKMIYNVVIPYPLKFSRPFNFRALGPREN